MRFVAFLLALLGFVAQVFDTVLPDLGLFRVDSALISDAAPAAGAFTQYIGSVTLYAVIHSDGTVGDVKVLESPDERLDGFARSALLRWHFRPAMKNGVAVALEAVVRIPFQPAAGW